jgi:hypothetical protein
MPVKKPKSIGKTSTARPSRRRAPVAELAPAVWDEDIRGDCGLDTPDRIEARPVMLLVVGPHRSGTSVAARALECLGAVNSLTLNPPNEFNPKGYFEDNDIYQFNDHVLLPALQHAWYSTCPVDWTVLSNAERSRLGLQALEIVRRNYPLTRPLSILKEPRISALLPFWLSVLQHAGFAVRLVGAVRDPLSVARSLRQRDGFSLTHGGMLYLTTWVSILQQAGETTLAFVSFEDLLANPSKALRRAADRLQLILPADFEARAASFAAGHVDRDLCHSIVDPNDVSLEPDLPPPVTELFAGLREAVSSQNARKAAKAVAAAERLVQAMLPALADFDHVFWERLNERQKARGASELLQQQVQAYQARVQELEQSSSTLQHQLQSASAPQELANLRAQIEAFQVTASDKSARLDALTAALAARDAQLQELATRHTSLVTASQQREAEYSELVTRHTPLVTSHEDLTTRYQQLETAYTELAARHTAMVTSGSDLSARLDALEAQRQEAVARCSTSIEEQQRVLADRDNLAAQLESLRLEHSDLVTRHTSLVAASQQREAEYSELTTRHQSLATTHEDLVTRHTSHVTSHEDLAARHQQLDTAHAALIARHAALEAERSELVARRQLLATNLQSLEGKHSCSAKEVTELRGRCERAEAQRKEAIARAQFAERDLRKSERAVEHLQSLFEPLEKLKDEHEQLEAKIALLAAAREKLVSEKDDLTSRLTRAESERRNLQQNVDERFEELSKLTRQIISLEHEVAAQRTASLGIITDKQSLEEEVRALQRSVDERFREIAQLQEKLLTAQKSQRELSEDMRTIMSSRSWRLTGPVRRITQTVPRVEQEAQTKSVDFKRSYRTIQNSGLFDADYYLKNNPDISAKKVDPIKHYLLHGAREGRNPSPNFSTRDYLRRHPVLETDPFAPNPLVHFILSQAKAS